MNENFIIDHDLNCQFLTKDHDFFFNSTSNCFRDPDKLTGPEKRCDP